MRFTLSVLVANWTKPATRWPSSESGTPTTAASRTAGWVIKTCSTSTGEMFEPPRIIRCFLRETNQRLPFILSHEVAGLSFAACSRHPGKNLHDHREKHRGKEDSEKGHPEHSSEDGSTQCLSH